MDLTKLIIFGVLVFTCVFVRPSASQLSQLAQRAQRAQRGQRGQPRGLMGSVGRIQPPRQRCNTCPPPWLPYLEQFRHFLTPQAMRQVCPIARRHGFLGKCGSPGTRCTTNSGPVPTRFCCCPAISLSKVAECVDSRNICVPEDFRPWQNQLQGVIMSAVMG